MAAPWLTVAKFIVANLDTIFVAARPLFTRRKVESLPNQTDLLNQQISELQAASSTNAEQIKALAKQLRELVTALEEATAKAVAEREKSRRLALVAILISGLSLVVAVVL